jgi:hypothetical protein
MLHLPYWKSVWKDEGERGMRLAENLKRIRSFRSTFQEFGRILPALDKTLPGLLAKLYSDCQAFAEMEIGSLLQSFEEISSVHVQEQEAIGVEPDGLRNLRDTTLKDYGAGKE